MAFALLYLAGCASGNRESAPLRSSLEGSTWRFEDPNSETEFHFLPGGVLEETNDGHPEAFRGRWQQTGDVVTMKVRLFLVVDQTCTLDTDGNTLRHINDGKVFLVRSTPMPGPAAVDTPPATNAFARNLAGTFSDMGSGKLIIAPNLTWTYIFPGHPTMSGYIRVVSEKKIELYHSDGTHWIGIDVYDFDTLDQTGGDSLFPWIREKS